MPTLLCSSCSKAINERKDEWTSILRMKGTMKLPIVKDQMTVCMECWRTEFGGK